MKRPLCWIFALLAVLAACAAAQNIKAQETRAQDTGALKAVTFKLDVTPPLGAAMAYATHESRENPISIRGAVFDDGEKRVVWLACDYLYVCGETYLSWRQKIAQAAGCEPLDVFLHSVHQHESMMVAPEYNPKEGDNWKTVTDISYCEKTISDLTALIREKCAGAWTDIAAIYTAEQRVWGLGACRRVLDQDGKLVDIRWSRCSNPLMHSLPVGVIDPILRTICFEDLAGKKFLALHFYASHPQTESLRPCVSPDVPGYALRMMEAAFPETESIYFTGCGGNVTFGKYNIKRGAEGIAELGERLGGDLIENMSLLQKHDAGKMKIVRAEFDVPFNIAALDEFPGARGERTYVKNTIDLWKKSHVTRLSFGPDVHLLSFELAEVCVEYQLYAQALVPTQFLAAAAYGNGLYEYIPTAAAYGDGSYETQPRNCPVAPEIEAALKGAIDEALNDLTEK